MSCNHPALLGECNLEMANAKLILRKQNNKQ